MVFFDNIKGELNAFKSHSNHKNTWWLDYYYSVATGKYLSKDLIQTITFFFEESCCNTWLPPPELTLSEMQHWMSVPNPGPEMVRNYQRLEIILKIN